MKELPFIKYYPSEFDGDEAVKLMTDEELGFYTRCLNHSWQNEGLPNDLDLIARIFHRTKAEVERLWIMVGKKYKVSGDRLINERQEAERAAALKKSETNRKAIEQRWNNERNTDVSEFDTNVSKTNIRDEHIRASASVSVSDSLSQSSSSEESARETMAVEEPTSQRENELKAQQQAWFERWWERFWNKRDKAPAFKAFRKHIRSPERFSAMWQAFERDLPMMLRREPDKRPYGATWLNKEPWEDGNLLVEMPKQGKQTAIERMLAEVRAKNACNQ